MKTFFLFVVICLFLLSCDEKDAPSPFVSKKVTFRIYTSPSNPPLPGDTTWIIVELKAFVSGDNGNTGTRIWDTTLERRRVRLYPDSIHAVEIVRNFVNIDTTREWVYWERTTDREGYNYNLNSFAGAHLQSAEQSKIVQVEVR